jgi:very-short-patch-repair endonuclease
MGYDFHRQKPIENFIVDFFCNKLCLGIELDGVTHGFEEVIQKDKLKEKQLNKLGINVLRFTDSDVMENIEGVLSAIQNYIEEFEKKNISTD